jgi:hypothetical protein
MEGGVQIYKSKDNKVQIDVHLVHKTIWLNRQQLALLFDRDIKTIGKHINNVFKEGELLENSVVAKFATTASDGKTYRFGALRSWGFRSTKFQFSTNAH